MNFEKYRFIIFNILLGKFKREDRNNIHTCPFSKVPKISFGSKKNGTNEDFVYPR